jgi:hypothetical protein
MTRLHIACQAAHLIRNKCRGRATRRPYIRLRPMAYVTHCRPRGCIGSPPGWEVVALCGQVRTRLGPDTCRHRTPAGARPGYSLSQSPGTQLWATQIPHRGVRDPSWGFRSRPWGSRTLPGGPIYMYRGLTLFHWGPDPLLISWSISSSLATWRLRTRLCGGVERCSPCD